LNIEIVIPHARLCSGDSPEANDKNNVRLIQVAVIARHSRSKNGVASLACGDEAIQLRASRAKKDSCLSAPAGAQLDCFASLAMTI
jgi:hypothetical protein